MAAIISAHSILYSLFMLQGLVEDLARQSKRICIAPFKDKDVSKSFTYGVRRHWKQEEKELKGEEIITLYSDQVRQL